MGRVKGNETILAPAVANSDSLRTTVPLHIVQQFKLKPKDHFSWELKVEGGELQILVTPRKRER